MPTRAHRMRRKASMCKFGSKETSVWNRCTSFREKDACVQVLKKMQVTQRIHESVSLRGHESSKNVKILNNLAIHAEHSIQSRRSCSFTSSCKNHLLLPGMTLPTAHSPLTLSNLSPFNIVSIFRYPRTPCSPVYARLLDLSALAFSLSLHRHPYICIPCSFRFI